MREMRLKDRMLTEEEAMDVVRKGEYGVLSTVGEDGKPYAVPLSYVLDEEKKVIYSHGTAAGGQIGAPCFIYLMISKTYGFGGGE